MKVISNLKPNPTSEMLVESINAAHSSIASKVLAAQRLHSREILVTADSCETKKLIEHEKKWTKVVAEKTEVKGQRLTVLAHAVLTNMIQMAY